MAIKLETGTHVRAYVTLYGGELEFEVSYNDRHFAMQSLEFSVSLEELKSTIRMLEEGEQDD